MNEIKEYVERKGWEYKVEGEEIICKVCPICNTPKWKFYINSKSGLYHCWICEANKVPMGSGHISNLKSYLGDVIPLTPISGQQEAKKDPDFTEKAEYYHSCLSKGARKYLAKRMVSEEVIKEIKIGQAEKAGEYFISIPIWENGTVKNIKYRKITNNNPEIPKYIREEGGKSLLMIRNFPIPVEVILTEGEIDTLTLWSQGYTNVVGNTGGAGTLLPEWYDILNTTQKVYVCYDNDQVGQKAAKETVAKRLGLGKVFNVLLPEGVGDINEFFVSGHTKEEFDTLLNSAKEFNIPGVVSASDAVEYIYRAAVEGDEQVIKTPWRAVNKLLKGGLKNKNLLVLGAPPKIGKTHFSLQMSWWAAKVEKVPTLFFCQEMSFEELARIVVCLDLNVREDTFDPMSAGIYASKLEGLPLYLGYSPRITNDQVAETFKEAQKRYGIGLAMFDNLHWLVRGQDVTSEIGITMRMFKTLAMEMDIPILVVAQPRKMNTNAKGQQRPMNYWDFKDSAAIPADADILCILHRDRIIGLGAEEAFEDDMLFRVDASRFTPGGSTILKFDGEGHRIIEEVR